LETLLSPGGALHIAAADGVEEGRKRLESKGIRRVQGRMVKDDIMKALDAAAGICPDTGVEGEGATEAYSYEEKEKEPGSDDEYEDEWELKNGLESAGFDLATFGWEKGEDYDE
jgi:hypothetical protein